MSLMYLFGYLFTATITKSARLHNRNIKTRLYDGRTGGQTRREVVDREVNKWVGR
jgi:hypothetical protein